MEIWKSVINYPNYQVSNFGRIRNVKHQIIKQSLDGSNHSKVMLYKNGKKYLNVHKIVFEAFYRRILPNEIVHHLNNNKTDNNVLNLVAWDKTFHKKYHNTGRKATEETKRKQSIALKGRKFTPQHIANIIKAQQARRLKQKSPQ